MTDYTLAKPPLKKVLTKTTLPGHFTYCAARRARQRGRNSVVECQLPKLDAVGSTPIARSFYATTGMQEGTPQGRSSVLYGKTAHENTPYGFS